MINTDKPTTSFSNITKINIGLVWGADLLQWQNESRTWGETVSVIDNITKISSSITNNAKP